jgi:Fe2+ or Zn2+ uptake regulation protein
MPLTKRQFELGIEHQTEGWMQKIYQLLSEDRDHAYSSREILEKLRGRSHVSAVKLPRALEVLVGIGAVETREVDGTYYYAFYREVDQATWELR